MRTKDEQKSGIFRRVGQRLRRLARAAGRYVRAVLKRVQGEVVPRHVDEASICAPATTARCHFREAEIKRGLPGGYRDRVCMRMCGETPSRAPILALSQIMPSRPWPLAQSAQAGCAARGDLSFG